MSDQRMNASDQGSQPDSGSDPRDQVTIDGQGATRGKGGSGARPASSSADAPDVTDVTEAAHKKGQHKEES